MANVLYRDPNRLRSGIRNIHPHLLFNDDIIIVICENQAFAERIDWTKNWKNKGCLLPPLRNYEPRSCQV